MVASSKVQHGHHPLTSVSDDLAHFLKKDKACR